MADLSAHEKHAHCGCCGRCGTARNLTMQNDFCTECRPHLLRARINGLYIEPWDRTYYAQHKQPCPLDEAS